VYASWWKCHGVEPPPLRYFDEPLASIVQFSTPRDLAVMSIIFSGGSKGWPGATLPHEIPLVAPYKIGCKLARLHNNCIHSVASHSWCQVTPLIQSLRHPEFLPPPKYRRGHPVGHPKLLQLETPLRSRPTSRYHCQCERSIGLLFSLATPTHLQLLTSCHSEWRSFVQHGCRCLRVVDMEPAV